MFTPTAIPGYTYGDATVPRSPISLEQFDLLKKSVLFGEEDVKALRQSYDILKDQTEAILDVWYDFVGANPHLLAAFTGRDGQPLADYLAAVRKRFGQWILDTARAEYNDAWLAYQHEIGLRHHRTKKNRTDGVTAADHVPFRYLAALLFPITLTLKPFLAKGGHSADEVEQMYLAWVKSVLLQIILWSYPYVKDGDY